MQAIAAPVQSMQAAAVKSPQVKASSLGILKVSGLWEKDTGLMHRTAICFVCFVKSVLNNHLIVTYGIKGPAQK